MANNRKTPVLLIVLISSFVAFAAGFFVMLFMKGTQTSLMYMNNPSDMAVLLGYTGLFFSIVIPTLFIYALVRFELFICRWERRTNETKQQDDSVPRGSSSKPC